MNLELMRYFLVVAQIQHMSRAAEELNISQPALSMNIQKLEADLGVRLFDRRGKSICLNEAGKVFFDDAREILKKYEESKEKVRKTGENKTTVRFHSSPMASFPKLMSSIYSASNGLFIEKVEAATLNLADLIENGEIDISMIGSRISDKRLVRRTLSDDELVMLVPGNHRLAKRESVDLSEFNQDNFAYSRKAGTTKSELDKFSSQAGFSPKLVYQCFSLADLVEAVKYGDLVALAPLRALAAYDTGDAVVLRVHNPVCTSHIYLYWGKNTLDTPALNSVKKAIIKYFDNSTPILENGKASLKFKL